MKPLQLYKLLRRNSQLKDERHPMLEKNKFMKFLMIFMWLYYAAILVLLGVVMPSGMRDQYNGVAAFHVLDGGLLYILIIDFWLRFVLQETPVQQAKPYPLLPIRRSFLMNIYLIRAGLSWGNLFWAFMLVPFGLLAILHLMGFGALVGWWFGWWLLIVADSYAYLLCRTLIMKNLLWVLLPAAIHGGLVALMLVPDTNLLDMPCTEFMYGFVLGSPWPFLCMIAIIVLLYWGNYYLQMHMVYDEVAKKEDVELKHTSDITYLNKYGALGEYLKMEIKLRLRNKQVRMGFFVVLGAMLMLSAILDFSSVYDSTFMTSFVCLYDYIVLGMSTLVTIMCFEGNYIDGLMSRRESIYELLRAKYYFNSALLLIPFLLIIPSIVLGKISIWMSLGYLFLTVGVLYPICFQLAVYNNNTVPLNQKLTGKQANTAQNIVSMVLLFVPIGLERLFVFLLGNVWGYIVLIILGTAGICTHKIWIRNIYQRFMVRRYKNMEGFRASREG